MMVTDEQVAALRAYLSDSPEWQHLHRQLIQSSRLNGYGELVHAAFVTAVRRRFSPTYTRASIIRFVSGVRAMLSEEPDAINPRAAENLIRRALNEQVTDESDQESKARVQILLLAALIEDEELDDAGLDEFLDMVRTLTTRWWPN